MSTKKKQTFEANPSITFKDVFYVMVVFLIAILLRLLLQSGIEGSDDVVYLSKAFEISQNQHTVPSYVSHLRIGFLIPIAAFFKMFGANSFTFYLWPLLVSITHLMVIFLISRLLFNNRAALFIVLIASFFPLDMHLAGRAIADVPLSASLSLSVLFYLLADRTSEGWGQRSYYFLSGLFVGIAVIHKVPGIFIVLFFAIHFIYKRKPLKNILYMASGGILIFILTSLYFYFITDNPLYYFQIRTGYRPFGKAVAESGGGRYSMPLFFYPYYFFVSIQHIGLYFYAAFYGLVLYFFKGERQFRQGIWFVLLWFLTMLLIMTFLPVKLHPLQFIPKQTNYMMMFTTPVIILAGLFIYRINSEKLKYFILAVFFTSSLFFAFFQKNTIESHAYNSRQAINEIVKYPGKTVFAGEYSTHYFRAHNLKKKNPITYHFFDELFFENINKAAYRRPSPPESLNEKFIEEIKNRNELLVVLDTRLAKRQKNKYYYPTQDLLHRPETGLTLIKKIKRQGGCRLVMEIMEKIAGVIRNSGLPKKFKKKFASLFEEVFNPDPTYIYIK